MFGKEGLLTQNHKSILAGKGPVNNILKFYLKQRQEQFFTSWGVWITLSSFPDWVLATVWSSRLWIGLAACNLSVLKIKQNEKSRIRIRLRCYWWSKSENGKKDYSQDKLLPLVVDALLVFRVCNNKINVNSTDIPLLKIVFKEYFLHCKKFGVNKISW